MTVDHDGPIAWVTIDHPPINLLDLPMMIELARLVDQFEQDPETRVIVFRSAPQVTIAQIEGRARGGGSEFALSLDLRFPAIGRAVLGQPEVALGLIPGGGGNAETAEEYGWVNRALPPDEIGPFVERLAHRIASFPAHAAQLATIAVDAAAPSPVPGLLAEAHAWNQVLADPELDARFERAMASGAQTRAGELDLGPTTDRSLEP